MESMIVKSYNDYQFLFDIDEIVQFLQISYKEDVISVDINTEDNSVWIPYDKKIALKTNLNISLEKIIQTLFNIPSHDQIQFTKIIKPGEIPIEYNQDFLLQSLEEIKNEYENLIIEFSIF